MKKFLALLLAIVMVLGMLAGCSSKKKTSSSKKSSSKKNKESTSATDDTDGTGSTDDTGSTDSTKGNGNGSTDDTQASNNKKPVGTVQTPTEITTPTEGADIMVPSQAPNISIAPGATTATDLDAPEKIYNNNTGDLQIEFTVNNNGQITPMAIIVDEISDDSGIVYLKTGDSEAVVEVTASGLMGYYRTSSQAKFTKDPTVTEDDLDQIFDMLSIFTEYQYQFSGAKYRKINNITLRPTGPVYAYNVIMDNQSVAQICIDQATGLLVYMKNMKNGSVITVQGFKDTGVQVPTYK